MKWISKEEKFALVEKYPNAESPNNKSIFRTMVQKSKRGHYAVAEHKWIIDFLNEYWEKRTIERLEPSK